ncbi:MAG: hypothetical protein AVDCRST_MAG77-4418 [uncultured Chloroflexi bacterium]|uniref:Uncharacterized protein n=1 Tax=uncultured Chloroflexota bacterium TaxID=166587 RepID=A0A6J4JTY4_9CHLR|nr:MAG: hypothetical protein AVDCRST_MAG77-4418 [uncultured Chloroflexota bacterium]
MALWTRMPPVLVNALREAGYTTDGLCPDCWRARAGMHGVRLPRFAAVDHAIQELPDHHGDPFAALAELGDEGA